MIDIKKDCYREENYYNHGLYETYKKDIKKYINEYSPKEYKEIIAKDKRTEIVEIFSSMRANIIKWYPFETGKKILEIGANYGEITSELVKMDNIITSIEFSEEKAICISKRIKQASNLKLILCTKLNELKLEEKYDYIIMVESAEYAKALGFQNMKEMLDYAYALLNENGKILLAVDNRIGTRFLLGGTKEIEEEKFAMYKPYLNKNYKLYGKKDLEEMISKLDGAKYKFYYPVPNYRMTHMIYTDEYLPKVNRYNIYYRDDEEILLNESFFVDELIHNDLFDKCTTSFLIEISKDKLDSTCYVGYSNMRADEKKIITKLSKEQVVKKSYSKASDKHIERVKDNIEKLKELNFVTCEEEKNGKIVSKFVEIETMDRYLENILLNKSAEEFDNELEKWKEYLLQRIPVLEAGQNDVFDKYKMEVSAEQKKGLTILKEGFIDLLFQNVFYNGNEYIVFDQEWFEVGVPFEYLIYRSVKQLYFQCNKLEEKKALQSIYDKYNITPYIEIFDQLEQKYQEEIIDKDILNFYSEKWSRLIGVEDIKFRHNQELGKVYNAKDEMERKLHEAEYELNRLKGKLSYKMFGLFKKKNK